MTFTASNGRSFDGAVVRDRSGHECHRFGKYTLDALREFFQHERDEELGRWRWPENPDYVVYLDGGAWRRSVTIVRESTGGVTIGMRESFLKSAPDGGHMSRAAARAYFEAHPESKPWHDAKAGEVWVLTIDGEDVPLRTIYDGRNVRFFPLDDNSDAITYGVRSSGITDGRKIWPES